MDSHRENLRAPTRPATTPVGFEGRYVLFTLAHCLCLFPIWYHSVRNAMRNQMLKAIVKPACIFACKAWALEKNILIWCMYVRLVFFFLYCVSQYSYRETMLLKFERRSRTFSTPRARLRTVLSSRAPPATMESLVMTTKRICVLMLL